MATLSRQYFRYAHTPKATSELVGLRVGLLSLFSKSELYPEARTRAFFEGIFARVDLGAETVLLKLTYADLLLRYMSVQEAKLQIKAGMEITREVAVGELQVELSWFRLINHYEVFFRRQSDWIRGLCDMCAQLDKKSGYDSYQQALPAAVWRICETQNPSAYLGMLYKRLKSVSSTASELSFEAMKQVCEDVARDNGFLRT